MAARAGDLRPGGAVGPVPVVEFGFRDGQRAYLVR